jgi:IPT/TIG domain
MVLKITAVNPPRGSSFGGTSITITGVGIGNTATVSIGGVPALKVVVVNHQTITATTPQHPTGANDIAVTSDGFTSTLAAGFTFEPPNLGPNQPPTIASLGAQGTRPNQPAAMADLNELINVTALVTDLETPTGQLTYEWAAPQGTFSGSGTALQWRAPSGAPSTPFDVTLTLTVIEKYTGVDSQGLPTQLEHRVNRTVNVRVHDSVREVRNLAEEFLVTFSNSNAPVSAVMSGFSTTCDGGAIVEETKDVEKNRCLYTITASFVGSAATTIGFRGTCRFPAGSSLTHTGDGCALVPVSWTSTVKATALSCPVQDPGPGGGPLVPGTSGTTTGDDLVTAVYEGNRWRLCRSDYKQQSGTLQGFKK